MLPSSTPSKPWHTLRILALSTTLTLTESLLNHFPQSHVRKFPKSDLQQKIVYMMDELTIYSRLSRSISFIGKTLKFTAGTPNYDDFSEIRLKQDQLPSANNRPAQVNNLTPSVNILLR